MQDIINYFIHMDIRKNSQPTINANRVAPAGSGPGGQIDQTQNKSPSQPTAKTSGGQSPTKVPDSGRPALGNLAPMAAQKGTSKTPQATSAPDAGKSPNKAPFSTNQKPPANYKGGKKDSNENSSQDNKRTGSGQESRGKDSSGPDWKDKQDKVEVYHLQQYFTFEENLDQQKREQLRWKTGDKKGNKKTLYMKSVQKANDLILNVAKQSKLEQNMNYEDRWPLLNFRKELMKVRILINMAAINVMTNKLFENFCIMVILANSFTLAQEDPLEVSVSQTSEIVEKVFLALYSAEMIIKILGLGFILNKGSYLRSVWNILDFVIIGSAYLTIMQTPPAADPEAEIDLDADQSSAGFNLNSLRAFRVLRPLRAITSIKGLRVLVLSVIKAMPLLKDTLIVLMFFFLIFAIASTMMLSGLLKQTCVNIETGEKHIDQPLCGGMAVCEPGYFCGKQNENPDFGVTNFDNVLYALINVFVCITLEGWSDIQVYYQKTFSEIIFCLFLPIVFLGAFFLLNLTLAVINSSFGRTHKHYQELEMIAKEKARKNKLRKKNEEVEVIIDDDEDGEKAHEIGVQEFFIAKRASKKMFEFVKLKRVERLKREEEEKIQKAKNEEEGGDGLGDIFKTPANPTPKLKEGQKETASRVSSPGKKAVIVEEDEVSEEEDHEQVVLNFLKEINNPVTDVATKKNEDRNHVTNTMALNDLRRAQGTKIAGVNPVQKNIQEINTKLKPQHQQSEAQYSAAFTDGSRIDDLLDIEKVIGRQQDFGKADKEDSGEHPFDLSFIQSQINDYPDFSESESAKGKNVKKNTSFDNFDDSAIESDGSLKNQIDHLRTEKKNKHDQAQANMIAPEFNPQKQAIMKDINRRFKRMQTTDFQKKDPLNDSQSTFYGIGSVRPAGADMQSAAGFTQLEMKKQDQSAAANTKEPERSPEKQKMQLYNDAHKKRQDFLDQINNIDDAFLKDNRPKDPYEFIDKKTQKIEITAKVAYRSTSQDEVFEVRNQLAEIQAISKNNNFIQMNDAKELADDDENAKQFVRPGWKAYQLKSRYDIQHDEQVEFESDDEDALILALQPFDTVMSVGYGQLLTHLPTKFRSRRSDIIVSSTLSITLIPSDPEYRVKDLTLLKSEEVDKWCDIRQLYRASSVFTATFQDHNQTYQSRDNQSQSAVGKILVIGEAPIKNDEGNELKEEDEVKHDEVNNSEESGGEANAFGGGDSKSDEEDKFLIQNLKQKLIPPNLLSKPLPADKQALLNDEERRLYNIQKTKFDAALKKIKKMPIPPEERRFEVAEAHLMLGGTFHDVEDGEDEKGGFPKANAMTYLGRDDNFKEEKLEMFEQAIQKVFEPSVSKFDYSKIKGDNIPAALRVELDLPEDMENNIINYDQVRKKDCNVKRKTLMWSGQDVLDVGLNTELSEWVAEHITRVRVWPKGCPGYYKKVRVSLRMLVRSSFWDNFLMACVMGNTVQMAMERYNQPAAEMIFMEKLNSVFTWIFIVEMFIKINAIGPKKYLKDKMNWLDGFVVSLSIFEMLMALFSGSGGNLSAFKTIRIFRTFRVLRVVRLLRALHSMQVIIQVIQRSASSFLYITMLLFVFIFIFTLLGMQVFGGKFSFPGGKPRGNYDTFSIALVTVFQVLTMENWNTTLYDSMRSPDLGYVIPSIYYVVWIFIGNFILLNLFLAILLDSFLTEDDEDDEDFLEAERQAAALKREKIQKEKERRIKKLGPGMFKSGKFNSMEEKEQIKQEKAKKTIFNVSKRPDIVVDNIDDLDENAVREIFSDEGIIKKKDKAREEALLFFDVQCENALYLMPKKSKCRTFMYKMYKHKLFDQTIMLLIGGSSIKLAGDTYLAGYAQDSLANQISGYIDLFLNCCFYIECVTKICAMGFAMDQGSYIRDTWNQLDFFIVCSSILDLSLSNIDIPALKILRLLRTLRPLRVISHNVAMKLIVASLFESVGAIANVVIVVVCVWLMFAIFAINIFAGKMFYCTYGKYTYHDKYTCNVAGGSWVRSLSNYDDILQAMMTLFVVASLEGWPDIMIATVDATGVNKGPEKEATPIYAVFYMIFILIGSFFLLNFFIGVLFLKYTQAQKNEQKGYTQANLNWIDIQYMIIKAECPHDISNMPDLKHAFRRKIWKLVRSNPFDYFIMGTIMLNVVQMALGYEGQPASVDLFLQLTNYIFTAIFICEAVLKLIAYGFSYFKTMWNKFDFFIVITSIIDILMSLDPNSGGNSAVSLGPQLARIMRVLRVSRILRLAGKNPGLQALMQTITMSVGALANVFLLLLLVLFIFSVMAVFFFGNISTGNVIGEYKNFQTWGKSFLLLFIIATGENWPILMYDCMNTPPNCIDGVSCGSSWAPIFYIIFVILVQNVMLNLFILVIIQQFETYYVSDDNPIQKFKDNLSVFMDVWIEFTSIQYRCVKIREKRLYEFFKRLPPPIGLPFDTPDSEMKKTMIKMGIRCDDGFIYFNELLYRCMRRAYGNFKLNKRMQIIELKTQYKIMGKTLAAQNLQSKLKNQNLFFEKMLGNDNSVNPFLQMMYYRISFRTWVKAMRNVERRKVHEASMAAHKKKAELLGMPFIEQEFEEEKTEMKIVQIQLEQIVLLTSEEDTDSETQSQLNKSSQRQDGKSNRSNNKTTLSRKSTIRNGANRSSSNKEAEIKAKKSNNFKALQLIQGSLPQLTEGKEPKAK